MLNSTIWRATLPLRRAGATLPKPVRRAIRRLLRAVIAGEGPERQDLELLIRNKRLGDCVILLGHVPPEELDALYRRAHVVVLTSLSEGIPLVLMEAMVRGKIVLAPAITGIPELVIPGKTGFLYKPGDLGDFTRRIRFLRSSDGGRRVPD